MSNSAPEQIALALPQIGEDADSGVDDQVRQSASAETEKQPAAGFRLEELQIKNFGTFDGPPSVIRFGRGGAIFTGRNGVGKTTAIDAFRMLIAQEPSFNDATTPGSKKRDRSIRSYYQGVVGKRQHEGQFLPDVLRPYGERKFMAVAGNFKDASGRIVSAVRLVQYDAQGQGNNQRYIIAREHLDLARDFPKFETPRAIRAQLAAKGVRVYDTFESYRAALSGCFAIEEVKQAWALFERAIGTKTVDDLTSFMRDLILPTSRLTETADELVQSTAALDEAFETVKKDEDKIKRLHRIVGEIDSLEQSYRKTTETQQLLAFRRPAATAVFARAVRRDLAEQSAQLASLQRDLKSAARHVDDLKRRTADLELQERELGGQAVTGWRRDIDDFSRSVDTIKSDLKKLDATLASLGLPADLLKSISFEESHHNEGQWTKIRSALRRAADKTPGRTNKMDMTLNELSAEIHGLKSEIEDKRIDLKTAERAKSNLPRRLIEVREQLAQDLGVATNALPFFGELLRVAPVAVEEGWEGALNRLLGNQARRLLVPERLYRQAAKIIDDRHLGLKLEYDKVDLLQWSEARHGSDRVAGKLEVRRESEFAGYIRKTLDNRFDHICFDSADDGFRGARRALTKAGQSRDGARHIKDDRRRIDDRSSFMLGWDSTERLAYLRRNLRHLQEKHETAEKDKKTVHDRRDGLLIKADQMRQLAESMGAFETVDIAGLERQINEREQWIETATAKNPDYVALEAALNVARADLGEQTNVQSKLSNGVAVKADNIGRQKKQLARLEAELADSSVPLSAWKSYRRLASQIDPGINIFKVDPEPAHVPGGGIWEDIRNLLDSELANEATRQVKTTATLTRTTSDYLREYSSETAYLAAENIAREDADALRDDWRQRRVNIEGRELARHRERLEREMSTAIDVGIVNIKTQLDKERLEIRDTIKGINETLRGVTYDPARDTKIRFVAHDSPSKRIAKFSRDLRQVTDNWIGNNEASTEERYLITRKFINTVRDIPENRAWRREVLDSCRWFNFVAQEYKLNGDGSEEIVNDYDGASGSSGGQKERLAMTVMAAGLAWRFGMVHPQRAATSFRVLMLDEAFKNSHDDTTRALLDLFKAFGFQMIFAMPSKNLAVVSSHIERAFAVDTRARRTIITAHILERLLIGNRNAAIATALKMADEAGIDIRDLDLAQIDDSLSGLTSRDILEAAAASGKGKGKRKSDARDAAE